MADKYRALRPKRHRQCYRRDGIPKVRFTRQQARDAAGEYDGYHHYRCPDCGFWHAGRA